MKFFQLLVIVLILSACAAKKQAAEFEAQPIWIKQKPVDENYYTGVGSAKKVGTPHQYIEEAKRDALANLAEEISLTVSSTSVLHTIETESGFSETFNQEIRVSTEDYLEGFEPVDQYENQNSYWVYYRISKAVYLEKKAQKKKEALAAAKAKYRNGKKAESQLLPAEAMIYYLQGLDLIKNYLNEETPVIIDGAEIDLGNSLYSVLNAAVASLKIEPITSIIRVKRRSSLDQVLSFRISFNNAGAMGIPVLFSFTGGYLSKDRDISNREGYVDLVPGVINSPNDREWIKASIDLDKIALNAVDDLFIRGLLTRQKTEPARTEIVIEPPTVFLSLADHYCHQVNCSDIHKYFNETALNDGFKTVTSHEVDFIFTIKFNFRNGENAGGLYACYLDGELSLTDRSGKRYWAKNVENIKGIASSSDAARNNAFGEFVNTLKRLYFSQAFDELK